MPATASAAIRTTPAAAGRPAQRSLAIDVMRGLAITLVVFGHTEQGIFHRGWWGTSLAGYHFEQFIYSFHMPAFFFVSGIFLRPGVAKRGPARYTAEKLRTMLYPYLLWATLTYLAERFVLRNYVVTTQRTVPDFLLSLLTADISWFLPTLFLAVTVAMLARNLPPLPVMAVAIAAQIAMPWLHAPDLDALCKFLPFLLAGMWVGRGFERVERMPVWASALLAGVLAAGLAVSTRGRYQDHRWSLLPLGLAGIAMLLLVARVLGHSRAARALAWAGEGSFGIFLMSAYFQGGGRLLLERLFGTTRPLPQLVLPSLLAVVVPCWIYGHRDRLRLGWLFVWPVARPGVARLSPPAPTPPAPAPN